MTEHLTAAMDRILAVWAVLYDRLGDPRTKNLVILTLALMSAFGMIAPEAATALRDAVLSMAF